MSTAWSVDTCSPIQLVFALYSPATLVTYLGDLGATLVTLVVPWCSLGDLGACYLGEMNSIGNDVLSQCAPLINATSVELERIGGMDNIFVDVSLVNAEESPTNSFEDLCE